LQTKLKYSIQENNINKKEKRTKLTIYF